MEPKQKKQPMTFKRFLKGIFQWQTVLVSSAFLAMFAFLIYIIGNIVSPFKFDINSQEYLALEQTYLIIFIVGVVSALLIAIFSAKMIDDPGFIKKIFKKDKALKVEATGDTATELDFKKSMADGLDDAQKLADVVAPDDTNGYNRT